MADFKVRDMRRFAKEVNKSPMILDTPGSNVDYVGKGDIIEKQAGPTVGGRDYSQYGEWAWAAHPSQIGRLSYYLLRFLYRTSGAVRPCVDGIAKSIANLEWRIINKDMKYHPSQEVEELTQFLTIPNTDKETFNVLLEKFLIDLIVIGKGVIEKVRNPYGQLVELVARDAALFIPIYDKMTGVLLSYREYKPLTYEKIADHDPKNFIFRYFNPTSYSYDGLPIIETIVNEIATLLLAVKAIGWIFANDELPPGVLHLGTIGDVALNRAKASFEAQRGIQGATKLRVVDNVDDVNWVQFTRPFREMQVAELMPQINKIIASNFGLSLLELGLSDYTRPPTGQVQVDFTRSKLNPVLMNTCAQVINTEVISEVDKEVKFLWVQKPQETFEQQSLGHQTLWRSALETRNEARLALGLNPVEGGDQPTVLLGNEVVPLDDSGIPLYRNPPTMPPSSNKPGGPQPLPGKPNGARKPGGKEGAPSRGENDQPTSPADEGNVGQSLPITDEDFRTAFGLPLEKKLPRW